MTILSQFKALGATISRYFKVYGGWRAVLTSPLFLLSLIIVFVCGGFFDDWDKLIQSVVPNLLGFSLATYALLSAIIAGPLKEALQQKGAEGHTQSDQVNASFFHFIFIQAVSLIYSFFRREIAFDLLASKISDRWPSFGWYYIKICFFGDFLGSLLFIYSIMLVFGGAIAIYRLVTLSMRLFDR